MLKTTGPCHLMGGRIVAETAADRQQDTDKPEENGEEQGTCESVEVRKFFDNPNLSRFRGSCGWS